MIILLDLNYTLVSNSRQTMKFGGNIHYDVENETYRQWLVDLVISHHVILITARTDDYKEATLNRIASQLNGWQPDEAYFKPFKKRFMPAHHWKEFAMQEYIYPAYGYDADYLALESNANTRQMYDDLDIVAIKVPKDSEWDELPTVN